MRSILMLAVILSFTACVQDEGKVSSDSVSGDSGSTTGSTSGGTSGTSGGGGGTPSDPLYQFQWHLKNSAQDVGSYIDISNSIDSTPTAGVDMNVESLHDDGLLGAGVRIAISDSGIDYTHPDLDANDLPGEHRNYSFLDPNRWRNSEAYPSGNESHGTSVGGIIAAEGWNDVGGRGIAPSASYGAFKFILNYAANAHLSSYLDKQLDQIDGNFDIFNYSYGITQCAYINDYDDMIDAQKAAVENLRGFKGPSYVQSAGNSFIDADASVCFGGTFYGNTNATASLSTPYKIVTGAVAADGVKASYSTPGSGVWVSGLGGEGMLDVDPDPTIEDLQYFPAIFSTDIGDCSSGGSYRNIAFQVSNPFNYGFDRVFNPTCDYTNLMNGTSSAAPMVSGVVALMLEKNPALTWRDVKYILAMTARQVDYDPLLNELPHPDPTGLTTFGTYVYDYKWVENNAPVRKFFSNWYGFGLVDGEAAVQMADGWVPAPLGPLGIYVRTENSLGVWNHTSSPVAPAIGEDDTMVTSTDFTLAGVASLTVEAVQVRITTNHPDPDQLAIHLVSPQGTEHRLILAKSGIIADGSGTYYFLANGFLNEDSGGTWTLKVYDSVEDTSAANLTSWGINIHGH